MSELEETPRETFDVSMSPTIGKIAAALAKAQAVMGPAIKDSQNPHFRNDYASLASCIVACRPIHENGIAVTQIPLYAEQGVRLATFLLHESGEWIRGELWMPVSKPDAQGYGGGLTYARRYSLCALTGLAQDDDDGNAASQAVSKPVAAAAPKPGPAKANRAPKAQPAPAKPADVAADAEHFEAIMGAIGEADTFPGLHKLVMDSQGAPEAARVELFDALSNRAALLFVEAKTLADVKAGYPTVTQLGSPEMLREAANAATLRFRNVP